MTAAATRIVPSTVWHCDSRRVILFFAVLSLIASGRIETWTLAADHLQTGSQRPGAPSLVVPKAEQQPAIDGDLADACWRSVDEVSLGYATNCWWDQPTQKTVARVLADADNIYFAVRCFEADQERIVLDGKLQRGMVIGADAVELFLDPGRHQRRFDYFHVIITPDGSVHHGKGLDEEWDTAVEAKVGKFDGGWTVEASIPMDDLGVERGAIPKVWGLNICRQRPELAADMPKAARDAGDQRFDPSQWKLDDVNGYRLAEYTAWSPTMADFCGWPFYNDSRPFHFAVRLGHAVLAVGTKDVAPPDRTFEVLLRTDFDDGKLGPFEQAATFDGSFRGVGKSLGFGEGQAEIRLAQPLEDLEDVTMLFAMKIPHVAAKSSPGWTNGPLHPQRLFITGKAPDGRDCGPERYEFFLAPAAAKARTNMLEEAHKKQFGGGTFELYDTHADMLRWKPCGRVKPGPGPWAMVEGFFAEPSACQVRWPGDDWVIVRLRLGTFRRTPGPNMGQRPVPREQNYPDGLIIRAEPQTDVRLDDVVIYRGIDQEPPKRVEGVAAERRGEEILISWNRSSDNTLTAFYRVYVGEKLLIETHQLAARARAADVGDAKVTIVAVDLDDNTSPPAAVMIH